jgi:hypothetical protein
MHSPWSEEKMMLFLFMWVNLFLSQRRENAIE